MSTELIEYIVYKGNIILFPAIKGRDLRDVFKRARETATELKTTLTIYKVTIVSQQVQDVHPDRKD